MKNHAINMQVTTVIFIFLLCGCAKKELATLQTTRVIPMLTPIIGMEHDLLKQANTAIADHEKIDLLLQAATLMINKGNAKLAHSLLNNIHNIHETSLLHKKYLLQAQIALIQQKYNLAIKILRNINSPLTKLPEITLFFSIKRQAYQALGKWYQAALANIELINITNTDNTIYYQQLFYYLNKISISKLQQYFSYSNSQIIKGWLLLAIYYQQYHKQPENLMNAINDWRQLYPKHPANNTLQPPGLTKSVASKQTIALLLPLSGDLKPVGEAIKAGYMQAFFAYEGKQDFNTKIYDTNEYADLKTLYAEKLNGKVDFIIGPLTKKNVTDFYKINKKINSIVLNYINESQPNIIQIGINLSQEIELITQKIYQNNLRNVLIITEDSVWGHNVADDFKHNWELLANTKHTEIIINQENDFSEQLHTTLNIQDSMTRSNNLSKAIKQTVKTNPVMRQDLDVIFLATNTNIARRLVPLLKFNYVNHMPIYATSSIYQGNYNKTLDQDLNDVIFCEMPAILNNSHNTNSQQKIINQEKFTHIGYDAFIVMITAPLLEYAKPLGILAHSGYVYLNEQNKIIKQLDWAKFTQGKASKYYYNSNYN